MKRILSLILCLAAVFSLTLPCAALADTAEPLAVYSEETTTEDGITVESTLTIYDQARSSTRKAVHEKKYTRLGTTLAIMEITATFRFDGSTVSVVSKSVSRKDTYDSWTYTQESFTSSGGTVTLKGTLSKPFNYTYVVKLTLSCDKDGNITAT